MLKFYIIKQFIRRFINELFYYFRRLTKNFKTLLKLILFFFLVLLVIYLLKGGAV